MSLLTVAQSALEAFEQTNEAVYGCGIVLGSDEYFGLRKLWVEQAKALREAVREEEVRNETSS